MYHIIGAGGHAKVIIEILESIGTTIGGITDSNPEMQSLLGYIVSPELPDESKSLHQQYIIGIGNNLVRKKISEKYNLTYSSAIHPSANLSKRISIGAGTVIMAGVSINTGTEISDHCVINTNASVDHDCKIHKFAHLSPNCALAGNVIIGEGAHIGIGATVVQGVIIGRWTTIGAGAVVIKDVPDFAVIVGVPGKVIKYNKQDEG